MGKLQFSQSKFSKFLNGKGFYVALAVCLAGAGISSWAAVNKTMDSLNNENLAQDGETTSLLAQSEGVWQYTTSGQEEELLKPQEADTKTSQVPLASSASASSQSSSSQQSMGSSNSEGLQETLTKPEQSPDLLYILPVSGEFLNDYSQGELIKSVTMGDWRTHDGIDIAADLGTPVEACADGTVVSAYKDGLWGTVVILAHADGCQSVYAGLDEDITVAKGAVVRVGQTLGYVGRIDAETDLPAHLHFGVRRDGIYTDPLDHITNAERAE
ncbi:MAG: M23 family metallopeptidase [Oscillospiraceae bacterium]|jgi:murein DD-endopeptidase MepM/ murein hydrolase activator NlpD|nr:M23 family metallopeptidase [Oscillospiraceae bacterium]